MGQEWQRWPQRKKISLKGAWSESRDHLKNFKPPSGMDEATLFKFGKWIDYGKSHRRGEKFPLKGVWSGSRDPFSCKDEATLFKFGKWVEYVRVALGPTVRYSKPRPHAALSDIANLASLSDTTNLSLCRTVSNDVLWHGVAGMSCFALLCLFRGVY